MKALILLPRWAAPLGLALILIGIALRASVEIHLTQPDGSNQLLCDVLLGGCDLVWTLYYIGLIVGLLLVSFTRERDEDERVQSIRLSSWQWAVMFGCCFCVMMFLFVGFGGAEWVAGVFGNRGFLDGLGLTFDLLGNQMAFLLLFFLVRFRLLRWRDARLHSPTEA